MAKCHGGSLFGTMANQMGRLMKMNSDRSPGTVDRKLNHNGATMMMMTMTGIRNGPDPATLWAESPAGLMDVADPKIELWRVEAAAGMQEDHLVGEECHSMMCPHHHAEVVVLQMKKELLGNYGRPGVVS
jgi:hypothetical protein